MVIIMNDFYSYNEIEESLDEDGISGIESGFMIGYLGAI